MATPTARHLVLDLLSTLRQGAMPVRALATEAAREGRPWTEATAQAAAEVLGGEGTPIDDHRASAAYRAAMLGQSLRKLYAERPEEVPA